MGLLQPLNTDRGLTGIEQGINMYFQERDKAEERKHRDEQEAALAARQARQDEFEQKKFEAGQARQQEQDAQGSFTKGLIKSPDGEYGYSPEEAHNRKLDNQYKEAQIYALMNRNKNGGRGSSNSPSAFGNRVLPAQQVSDYSGANSSVQQLQDYQKLLDSNVDITGSGIGQNAKRGWSQFTGMLSGGNDISNRTDALLASQKKVAQVIGSYLEGGKLTDTDFQKYTKMLPTVGDPPEVAAAKSSQLQNLINQRQEQQKIAYQQAGYRSEDLGESKPDLSGQGLLKNEGNKTVTLSKGNEHYVLDKNDKKSISEAMAEGFAVGN